MHGDRRNNHNTIYIIIIIIFTNFHICESYDFGKITMIKAKVYKGLDTTIILKLFKFLALKPITLAKQVIITSTLLPQ